MKRDATYRILRGLIPGYETVAALTGRALVALMIGRKPQKHLDELSENFALKRARGDRRFERLAEALEVYWKLGRDLRLDVPLDCWWAKPFEMAVYKILRRTVRGEVLSYGEIAHRIGSPRHARTVGRALGRNQIMIAIPCHRVVEAGGGLGGFSAGLDLKRRLLAVERVEEEVAAPI